MDKHIDGHCHCGKIKYEADINPAHAAVCHCTDCQTLSGSAFRVAVPTIAGSFRLLEGDLKTYVKISENGNPREQTFCGECGSPIYAANPGPQPKVVSLRVGTIRQPAELAPSLQIWHRSSLPWLDRYASIDKMATQPNFEANGGFGLD